MRIVKTIYGNLREDKPYLGTGNARINHQHNYPHLTKNIVVISIDLDVDIIGILSMID